MEREGERGEGEKESVGIQKITKHLQAQDKTVAQW